MSCTTPSGLNVCVEIIYHWLKPMAIIGLPFQGIRTTPSGLTGLVGIVFHRLKPMAIIVQPFQGSGI